jgi:hypothetical protein
MSLTHSCSSSVNDDFGLEHYGSLFSCALNLSGSRGQGAALLGDHCRWLRRLL